MNVTNTQKVVALILAGGSSTRMKGVNKQLIGLDGVPVVIKSALAFENCPEVSGIVIAARDEDISLITELCREYSISRLIAVTGGGQTRSESARKAAAFAGGADIIMIHDGARPFVSSGLISRIVPAAAEFGAAVPAVALKDTVKFVSAEGFAAGTPAREALRAVQTPQAFRRDIYEKMLAAGGEATDDAGLAERLGFPVKLIDGELSNIKITTPEDIPTFGKNGGKAAMTPDIRIGHGYDVHLLAENRRLIIGGVDIPYELGLLGHSDADVLVHAVMDALLGALALGDIGKHFPDSDERYRGADSIELLKAVVKMISERGYAVSNLDCTINAERPKLAPYIISMRENIAAACGIAAERVSVKATTEEGLGLAGRGIGAVCVALVAAA